MVTLDLMAAAHYLNARKPTRQEVSKLSRWLGVDANTGGGSILLDEQQPSSIGSAGSDSFDSDSTHSSNNASRRQSPHFGGPSQPQQQNNDIEVPNSPSTVVTNEHNTSQMGWNVNAKSFQPVSIRHQPSPPPSVQPSSQSAICQLPMNNNFSYPPPPINGANPPIAMSHQRAMPAYSPSFEQPQHLAVVDQLGVVDGSDSMGMWQDPNAGLKRWQLYTGTNIWGNPEEKTKAPIQRWQDFSEEDCVEMLTKLDERAKKVPGSDYGWGELPSVENMPAPLQRVVHQSSRSGFAQQQQHFHHYQQPTAQYRRNSARTIGGGAYNHGQLLNNAAAANMADMYSQRQQQPMGMNPHIAMGAGVGWNEGVNFGGGGGPMSGMQHGHVQQQHLAQQMSTPNTPTFHHPNGGMFENVWMGGGARMVGGGQQQTPTPTMLPTGNNNVPPMAMVDRQRNGVFPPIYQQHPFAMGSDYVGSAVVGISGGGDGVKSIW